MRRLVERSDGGAQYVARRPARCASKIIESEPVRPLNNGKQVD